jgi:hypothetical protein
MAKIESYQLKRLNEKEVEKYLGEKRSSNNR